MQEVKHIPLDLHVSIQSSGCWVFGVGEEVKEKKRGGGERARSAKSSRLSKAKGLCGN